MKGSPTMIKKTLSTVTLLALAGCQQQAPAASPVAPGSEPAPGGEAVPAAGTPAAPIASLPPATPDERAKWFQSCWALFNAKDWQKFSACYAENATSEQVDSGIAPYAGRAEIVDKNVKAFASAFPDGTGEIQLTLVNGNNILAVVLYRGTHTGPLPSPTGPVAATNKKVGYLLAHSVETTDDGRAVLRDRFYFDAGTLVGQLGLNPAPHRKLVEVGWADKPVVLATNSEVEKTNLALAPKGVEAFNKHDVNAVLGFFADDIVMSQLSAPADTTGKVSVKKNYTELFKGFSDVKLEVGRTWAAGDYVVSEGTFSGTNGGDMPSWKIKKTGKKVSSRYLELVKVQGGKAKNVWIFDNGMAFAAQLGLLPPPGAKDPKAKTPAAAPAAKGSKTQPAAPAAKDSKAATPATHATPATPGAKPATPAPAAPAAPAKK
jgi:predicted ester cyclase